MKQLKGTLEFGCRNDVLVIVTNLQLGSRVKDGKITLSGSDRLDAQNTGKTEQEVTMGMIRTVQNRIMKHLQSTTDVSKKSEDPVACLDNKL